MKYVIMWKDAKGNQKTQSYVDQRDRNKKREALVKDSSIDNASIRTREDR